MISIHMIVGEGASFHAALNVFNERVTELSMSNSVEIIEFKQMLAVHELRPTISSPNGQMFLILVGVFLIKNISAPKMEMVNE